MDEFKARQVRINYRWGVYHFCRRLRPVRRGVPPKKPLWTRRCYSREEEAAHRKGFWPVKCGRSLLCCVSFVVRFCVFGRSLDRLGMAAQRRGWISDFSHAAFVLLWFESALLNFMGPLFEGMLGSKRCPVVVTVWLSLGLSPIGLGCLCEIESGEAASCWLCDSKVLLDIPQAGVTWTVVYIVSSWGSNRKANLSLNMLRFSLFLTCCAAGALEEVLRGGAGSAEVTAQRGGER
jgi:hypothetical protein